MVDLPTTRTTEPDPPAARPCVEPAAAALARLVRAAAGHPDADGPTRDWLRRLGEAAEEQAAAVTTKRRPA